MLLYKDQLSIKIRAFISIYSLQFGKYLVDNTN